MLLGLNSTEERDIENLSDPVTIKREGEPHFTRLDIDLTRLVYLFIKARNLCIRLWYVEATIENA